MSWSRIGLGVSLFLVIPQQAEATNAKCCQTTRGCYIISSSALQRVCDALGGRQSGVTVPDARCRRGICTNVKSTEPSGSCLGRDWCSFIPESDCLALGGTFEGDDVPCAVPTLSEWGLVVMALVLLTGAKIGWRRARA